MMTIDEELRLAADDLRRDLHTTAPPPLDRSATQRLAGSGGRFALVMASLAVFAIGGFVVFSGTEVDETEATASDKTETVVDETETAVVEDLDDGEPFQIEQTIIDPATGTALTPVETPDQPGSAILPVPVGATTWNADGSLLLLYEVGVEDGGHALYDGRTLARIRSLDILPVDIEQLWWDPIEPSQLYYVVGNDLLAHDVITDQVTVAHRFDGCDDVASVGVARAVSVAGRQFGSLCISGDSTELVAVDLNTGTEVRQTVEPGTVGPAPLVSGSGYVSVSATGTVVVYDNNLETTGMSFTAGTDQFVLIETADGRQLFVTTIFEEPGGAIGSVVGFDLSTGASVVAIGEAAGDPYPPSGTRLAASVTGGGQVVVSIVGDTDATSQTGLDGKVFLVDFDTAIPTVTQVADHRAGTEIAGIDRYWTAPHPGIHPDGESVAFAGGLFEGQITTFVTGPAAGATP